jgi:hypothetical protein
MLRSIEPIKRRGALCFMSRGRFSHVGPSDALLDLDQLELPIEHVLNGLNMITMPLQRALAAAKVTTPASLCNLDV